MRQQEIQTQFKRPESVLIVVATIRGEVLMLRRREPPDFWQSVTGSLEWGESTAAAAGRELEEETGLDDRSKLEATGIVNRYPIAPAWRHRYAPHVTSNIEHAFCIRLAARVAVKLNPEEHVEARWLERDAAAQLASSKTNREAILQLIGKVQ